MASIYYEKDGDPAILAGKRVAIVGYGSQGHAHALNLRDSGTDVVVACYPGSPSADQAKTAGLTVVSVEEAAQSADLLMMLIPDQTQKKVYLESIRPHLRRGQTLMFAHGANSQGHPERPFCQGVDCGKRSGPAQFQPDARGRGESADRGCRKAASRHDVLPSQSRP